MDFIDYSLLFLCGIVVGVINTLTGGGSLLTLPLLMTFGLPADVANGTNRLGILMGSTTAGIGFVSKKIFPTQPILYLIIPCLIGAWFGTNVSLQLDEAALKKGIGIILVISFFFLLFFKKRNVVDPVNADNLFNVKGLFLKKLMLMLAFFMVGFYGGFLQAGVGFIIMGVLSFFNFSINMTNAIKVIIVALYTVLALIIFYLNGKIEWYSGISLSMGMMISSWYVSRLSTQWNVRYIKYFLMVMLIIFAIKLWI